MAPASTPEGTPERPLTVSLIVNTTDRAGPLRTLLRSLEQQSYPHFEVIVVVGPTHDDTMEVLDEYSGRVRVLRCPEANLSQSRNIGLLAARGDIVAYTDDDAVPSRRWLEQLVRLFRNPHLDGTGGVAYLVRPEFPTVQFRLGVVSSLAEHVDTRESRLETLMPPGEGVQWVERMMGVNMAFRREALLDVGGFDEYYIYIAEETDLAVRLAAAGKYISPVREAPVYHVPASSRNRQVFSFKGNWWLHTRSLVYFCIKNGRIAGDAPRDILLRALHLVHGHWLWANQLREARQFSTSGMWRMRYHELRAGLDALFHGLLRPRKLIDPADARRAARRSEAILPFQNEHSRFEAAVDPISGYQSALHLTEPPLRIALLTPSYPPDVFDGVNRQVNLLARGLFELGHNVHVVAPGEPEQPAFFDGAYVHRFLPALHRYHSFEHLPHLHRELALSHGAYERVRRLIFNDDIQVVDAPLAGLQGFVTAVSKDVPVIVRLGSEITCLSGVPERRASDQDELDALERAHLEQAAHLLADSEATWKAAREHYGWHSGDGVTIISPGVVPVPEEAVRLIDPGRAGSALKILFVGRLEESKGILDLFEAIPSILERVPGATFVIAGQDRSMADGFQQRTRLDYASYFERHYPGWQATVRFPGYVSEERLNALYQECYLLIAPSRRPSSGLTCIEAMNYGKPVVACRVGSASAIVEHEVTGLLVDPYAPEQLADAAVSLLRSPEKAREMGLAGRQRVLERYDYLQMASRYAEVYRTVARQRERRHR